MLPGRVMANRGAESFCMRTKVENAHAVIEGLLRQIFFGVLHYALHEWTVWHWDILYTHRLRGLGVLPTRDEFL